MSSVIPWKEAAGGLVLILDGLSEGVFCTIFLICTLRMTSVGFRVLLIKITELQKALSKR
jgi:hypothetical protein